MATVIISSVVCDLCGFSDRSVERTSEKTTRTIEVREALIKLGWVLRPPKDLCPRCRAIEGV